MDYKVCYMMKRNLTQFIEGYTIGSKNLIEAASQKRVTKIVLSVEPWNFKSQETSTYVIPTLIAEKYYFSDLITALYSSFLKILRDYDIVHFLPNIAGDVYASFIRPKLSKETKVIGHFSHPYHPFIYSPFSNFRLYFLCNKTLDYIFCTNKFLIEYFRENTRIHKSRIFYVPFPVDVNKYKPLPGREKLRHEYELSEGYVVAFVGQVEPIRGVFMLIQAFREVVKRIDNIRLIITNPGLRFENPYIRLLKEFVKKLNLSNKVIFLPPQNNLEKIYNLADVIVFPYTQAYHYMDPPLTLLEAMACGAFVIVSAVGAVKDLVINGKNGKVIRPKSIQELAESIIDGVENIDQYRVLGMKARETIMSEFSMDRIGILLTETYNKILTRS